MYIAVRHNKTDFWRAKKYIKNWEHYHYHGWRETAPPMGHGGVLAFRAPETLSFSAPLSFPFSASLISSGA